MRQQADGVCRRHDTPAVSPATLAAGERVQADGSAACPLGVLSCKNLGEPPRWTRLGRRRWAAQPSSACPAGQGLYVQELDLATAHPKEPGLLR